MNRQVGLWQQYWTALDMCMSTVTPLFLALVLGLYAFSAVTKVGRTSLAPPPRASSTPRPNISAALSLALLSFSRP